MEDCGYHSDSEVSKVRDEVQKCELDSSDSHDVRLTEIKMLQTSAASYLQHQQVIRIFPIVALCQIMSLRRLDKR